MVLTEFVQMLPLSQHFAGSSFNPYESIEIVIFELFDNKAFGLQSVDLRIPNDTLQFRQATLRVKTILYGMKFLMVEWFWTTGLIVVSIVTAFMTTAVLVLCCLAWRAFKH